MINAPKLHIFAQSVFMKKAILLFTVLLMAFACNTTKKAVLTEYTFTVRVKEKYCNAARINETLIRESEQEKVYANQVLFLVKKGTTDTINYPTTVNGQFTRKFLPGMYEVYFPEKFKKGPNEFRQKCKDWRQVPDTTIVLDPSTPTVNLRLFRPCSPCEPFRQ